MVGVDVADAPVAELIHRLRMYAREGGNMKTATDLMDRATACLQGLLLQQLKGFCVEVKRSIQERDLEISTLFTEIQSTERQPLPPGASSTCPAALRGAVRCAGCGVKNSAAVPDSLPSVPACSRIIFRVLSWRSVDWISVNKVEISRACCGGQALAGI